MTKLDTNVVDYPLLMVLPKRTIRQEQPLLEGYSYVPYTPEIKAQWIDLQMEVGLFKNRDSAQEKADLFFEKASDDFLFVVDQENQLVASCGLWQGNHFGMPRQRIHYVAVHPNHQHKKIAQAMLTKLCLHYESKPTKYPLYLATQTGSYGAVALYSRLGFIPYLGEYPGCSKQENEQHWQAVTDILREKAQ